MLKNLHRLSPLYQSQKNDVELLALSIACSMAQLRLLESMKRFGHIFDGVPKENLYPYCEISYDLPFGKSGKIPKWQVQMLSDLVRQHLNEYDSTSMRGYRFVYDERTRVMSFYAQCHWKM